LAHEVIPKEILKRKHQLTEPFFLLENNTLTLHLGPITLRGGRPVLNGNPADDFSVEIKGQHEDDLTLSFSSPAWGGIRFGLFVSTFANWIKGALDYPLQIRYWVAALPPGFMLDSFGIQFEAIENLRAYLRNGYNSWDSSSYQEPESMLDVEAERSEMGYAMTQILPRYTAPGNTAQSVVIGFDRHDRFQHTFTFDTRKRPVALTILTLWDRKDQKGQTRCESERMVAYAYPSVENALRAWANLVADLSLRHPRLFGNKRLGQMAITGWCSWYNMYAYISEERILDHLHAAAEMVKQENLQMRVFQIDDGFTPEMGDWLEVKPQFPRGMKPVLDDIREAGFVPGLWIGPFMVGCRSNLYREHPDWVIKDRLTGKPITQMKMYGEWRWHKRSEEYYILDATHPEAFEYLRNVFHTWRYEWGCEYFKTDFMLFGSEYGPDRADWHTPGMTRIEIFHKVMEMIRQEIGEDATWLGCGCPLWASVGLVDGIRIGGDVGVDWSGGLSAQSLLRDQATRNFAHHILWQADPDCILLRERFHNLSDSEVRALAIYAGMSGGVAMTSDHMGELSTERVRLWKLLLNRDWRECSYPFLGQTTLSYIRKNSNLSGHPSLDAVANDPVMVQVRSWKENHAVYILNTGDLPIQRTYPLTLLGLEGAMYGYNWITQQPYSNPVEEITVTLARHDGALIFFSKTPISQLPERLP
jgi:alpha-galactosidase